MRKGLVSIVMLLAMVLIFVGCSKEKEEVASTGPTDNFNETGYPIVNEPITLEMMGKSSPIQPEWGSMGFFQELEKKTNIKFDFRTSGSDDYTQKKQLAFASLELPDLFYGGELTANEEMDYGTQELLMPLEDLIEKYAPNFKKLMDENPDLKPSITTPDGHIYALPGIDSTTQSKTPIMWMNGPWMDTLGISELETTDDFYELLKAFKEQDPNGNGEADEIPLTANSPADLRLGFLPNFGIIQQDGIYESDGKVDYAYIQDGYKEYLIYMNRLYNEQLLDNQMFGHTWEQFVAKGKRVGIFSTWPIVQVGFEDPAEALNYPVLPPLTSPINDEKLVVGLSEIRRGRAAITTKNEHPEETMRWIDQAYSEEGTILSRLGIEGETYEWNEDKTKWRLIGKEGMSTTEANAQHAPGVGTNVPMVLTPELFDKEDNPTIVKIYEQLNEVLIPYAKIPYPLVYFTNDEQKKVNTLKPDIDTYFEQMEAKFITGQESIEDGWDKYVSTLNDLGVGELVEVHQAAYDRWAEAK